MSLAGRAIKTAEGTRLRRALVEENSSPKVVMSWPPPAKHQNPRQPLGDLGTDTRLPGTLPGEALFVRNQTPGGAKRTSTDGCVVTDVEKWHRRMMRAVQSRHQRRLGPTGPSRPSGRSLRRMCAQGDHGDWRRGPIITAHGDLIVGHT